MWVIKCAGDYLDKEEYWTAFQSEARRFPTALEATTWKRNSDRCGRGRDTEVRIVELRRKLVDLPLDEGGERKAPQKYIIRRRFPVEYPDLATAESIVETMAGGDTCWKVVRVAKEAK